MAVITANVGSNNYNTNACWVGGVQPDATSDVIIPASAIVTIPTATTVLARSCTISISGTLAFASTTAVLTIGDATAGAGNVAFSNAGTITLTAVGQIQFATSSSTQQTLTTGGSTMPNMVFGSVSTNCNIQLADSFTSSGAVTLSRGTLDLNSKTCSWVNFSSSASNVRTLTMGSAAITLSGATAWDTTTVTSLVITANTAVVTCTSATLTFNTGNINYNGTSLVFTGSGSVTIGPSNFTVANLTRTGTAAKTDSILLASNQVTITNTLTINSNSSINRLLVASTTRGSARILNAASVIISNIVDFMDITGAGAATWTVAGTGATALGDAGGNSGITFSTPVTQTATGTASFTWSTHGWTSRVPLPQDNVVVNNAFSASQTVTIDMPRMGKNVDFSGSTGAPTISQSISTQEVFGSLAYASNNIISGGNTLRFSGRSAFTITTNGVSASGEYTMDCVTGTYTLQDNLTISTTRNLFLLSGTLDTNSKVFSVGFVSGSGSGARSLILGSTTLNLTGSSGVVFQFTTATNLTMSAASSTIIISSVSASSRTFAGGSKTYGTLIYDVAGSTGSLIITGSNTFEDITFSDVTNARTLQFTSATTTTITAPHGLKGILGTSGKLMTVNAVTGASAATLAFPNGFGGGSDWLSVQDITATTNTWYAGANSTNVSGNTNVTFTAAPVVNSGGTALLMGVG